MDVVRVGDRWMGRRGLSVAGLGVTGMWGEHGGRDRSVAAIRRAVELGAGVLEVPVPFGPFADLVRQAAGSDPAVAEAGLVARLTGPVPDLDAVRRRLGGRTPDLVLVGREQLAEAARWGVPTGVVVTPAAVDQRTDGHRADRAERAALLPLPEAGLAALRGPWPAPAGLVEWCERAGIAYLAPSLDVLAAGERTIAVPAPTSGAEVERLFAPRSPTPPAAEPG